MGASRWVGLSLWHILAVWIRICRTDCLMERHVGIE